MSKEEKFITLEKELLPPGKITEKIVTVPFHFNNVEMTYESYRGIVFNVIYKLKVILKSTFKQYSWEREIGVICPTSRAVMNADNPPFKLDVKIAKMLKLTFEMDHTKYGTKDICTGRVIFRETSMKMKMMMIQIIRKEVVVGGETDTAILCR
ncbi:MAG: vacuolar protein sorting-associated family 26 protein [archaeon]|nr:vacuolar protein sorting-associated family 26 protein [archaeon]